MEKQSTENLRQSTAIALLAPKAVKLGHNEQGKEVFVPLTEKDRVELQKSLK